MARSIPTSEPGELYVSDTWQWDKHLSDFPPSEGWSLSYTVEGPAVLASAIAATTSAEGDYFEVRHDPADHASLTQGAYTLIGTVTDGSDTFTVHVGTLFVRAFVTSAANQSHDETMLAAINALLEGRSTDEAKSLQIRGRSLERHSLEELLKLQGVYRTRVTLARRAGQIPTRKVHFRHA